MSNQLKFTIMKTIKNLSSVAIVNIVLAVLSAPPIVWGIAKIVVKVATTKLGTL